MTVTVGPVGGTGGTAVTVTAALAAQLLVSLFSLTELPASAQATTWYVPAATVVGTAKLPLTVATFFGLSALTGTEPSAVSPAPAVVSLESTKLTELALAFLPFFFATLFATVALTATVRLVTVAVTEEVTRSAFFLAFAAVAGEAAVAPPTTRASSRRRTPARDEAER